MSLHITLRQLEIFCAIYITGSALAAGDQLGLSQSAVSNGLKQLETQLDVLLFERVGKRLIHNEQGREFYGYALTVLEQTSELEQLFTSERGNVHIAASSTIGNYLLPPILAQLKTTYPNIHIKLTVANSHEIIEKIANFECDLGFIEGRSQHPNIKVQIWQRDELIWFCAKDTQWLADALQPQSLRELITKPLIMRETGSGSRELLERPLNKHGLALLQVDEIMELGNSEAIKQAVRYDLGIGCLSRHVLNDFFKLDYIQSIRLNEPVIERPLLMIEHRLKGEHRLLNLIKKFLEPVHD